MSTTRLVIIIVVGAVVLAVGAGFLGRALVRRGLKQPWAIRLINRTSERVINTVKRPLTIAVLDEVADVLRTGHYTRNIASALQENREEIKAMVSEKIKSDPTTRRIGLLPFHDRIIDETSETVLRVILELLDDPRTDELFSDLLRDNITQLRAAVRAKDQRPAPA
jgi:hypothetical protein